MTKSPYIMSFSKSLLDPKLQGSVYGDISTRRNWLAVSRFLFAEPPQSGDLEIYRKLTGRQDWPAEPAREAHLIVGRRGGKSQFAAGIGAFIASMRNYLEILALGERAVVALLAADRQQARVLLNYVRAYFSEVEMLRQLVIRETADGLELTTGCDISVQTSSFRSIRGRTFAAVIMDEFAYWLTEGAIPAGETIVAVRPGMTTIPGSLLLGISSPYRRDGPLYEAFVEHWGKDNSRTLIIRATSQEMNPTLPAEVIEAALKQDPQRARAEYLAEWRSDIAAALDPDWIDAVLIMPNLDRPRSEHPRCYRGFVDMSGGRNDSAALSISHCEPESPTVIVSLVRRWKPPFSPEAVVQEMAELLRQYGLHSVIGDNYSADLLVELFRKAGVSYERSVDSASDLYMQSVPLFSTAKIEAPDHPVLRRELTRLERRTRVTGKDSIGHPAGAHDDVANAACGAIVNAWRARSMSFDGVVLGKPMLTTHGDGALVSDFDGSWPRLS